MRTGWNKDAAIPEPGQALLLQLRPKSAFNFAVMKASCCISGSSWQYCLRFPEISLPWVISQKTVHRGWVPRSVTSLGHKIRITWAHCPQEQKWHKAPFKKTVVFYSHRETSISLFHCLFLALVPDVKRLGWYSLLLCTSLAVSKDIASFHYVRSLGERKIIPGC